MTDLTLFWNKSGADIDFSASDVKTDAGLPTAIMVALFSDGRANIEDALPPGETRLRGHWPDNTEFKRGSLLWLIGREKIIPEVAERARLYCTQALQYFIDNDIAASVEVTVELVPRTGLLINIDMTRSTSGAWDFLWKGVEGLSREILIGDNLLTFDIKL